MLYDIAYKFISKSIFRLLNLITHKTIHIMVTFSYLCLCVIPCYSTNIKDDVPQPMYKYSLATLAEKELALLQTMVHPGTLTIEIPSLTLPNYIELTKIRHLHIITDSLSLPQGLMAPELTIETKGPLAPANKFGTLKGPLNITSASFDGSNAKIYSFGPAKFKTTTGDFSLIRNAYFVMNDALDINSAAGISLSHASVANAGHASYTAVSYINIISSNLQGTKSAKFTASDIALKRELLQPWGTPQWIGGLIYQKGPLHQGNSWISTGWIMRPSLKDVSGPTELSYLGDIDFITPKLYNQASNIYSGGEIRRSGISVNAGQSPYYGTLTSNPFTAYLIQAYRLTGQYEYAAAVGDGGYYVIGTTYGVTYPVSPININNYLNCNTIFEPILWGSPYGGHSYVCPVVQGHTINMQLGNFMANLVSSAMQIIFRGNDGVFYNALGARGNDIVPHVQISSLRDVFELQQFRQAFKQEFFKKTSSGAFVSEHPFGNIYHPNPNQILWLDRLPTQMFFNPLTNISMDLTIQTAFSHLSGKTFCKGHHGTGWAEYLFGNAEQWQKENNKKIISAEDLQGALVPLLFYSIRKEAGIEHADLHLSIPSKEIVPYRSNGDIYATDFFDGEYRNVKYSENRIITGNVLQSIAHGTHIRETGKQRYDTGNGYREFAGTQQEFRCEQGPIFVQSDGNLINTAVNTIAKGTVHQRSLGGTLIDQSLSLESLSVGKRDFRKTRTHIPGYTQSTDEHVLFVSAGDNVVKGSNLSAAKIIAQHSTHGKSYSLADVNEDAYHWQKHKKNIFFSKEKTISRYNRTVHPVSYQTSDRVIVSGKGGVEIEVLGNKALLPWVNKQKNARIVPMEEVHHAWKRNSFRLSNEFKSLLSYGINYYLPGWGSIISSAITCIAESKGNLKNAAKSFTSRDNLRHLAKEAVVNYAMNSLDLNGSAEGLDDRIKSSAFKSVIKTSASVFIERQKLSDILPQQIRTFGADVVFGHFAHEIGENQSWLGSLGHGFAHLINSGAHGMMIDNDPGKGFISGAIGGVVGEGGAELTEYPALSKFVAGTTSFALKQNVDITLQSADIAIENNWYGHGKRAKKVGYGFAKEQNSIIDRHVASMDEWVDWTSPWIHEDMRMATPLRLPENNTELFICAGSMAAVRALPFTYRMLFATNPAAMQIPIYVNPSIFKHPNFGRAFPNRQLLGKDGIYLPESMHPHTRLAMKEGRTSTYPQAMEFTYGGKPTKRIDFTDHGRPSNHPNPHQHRYKENSSGGTLEIDDKIEPLTIDEVILWNLKS